MKLCVVTGATSGIGKEAARALAAGGEHVVAVGRNPERLEGLRRELTGRVDTLRADLARQDDVRALAAEILGRYPKIDVLLSNAGVFRLRRHVTVDGCEETIAVNHLAPFLLVNLLAERLRASAPARVVVVASTAHRGARLDLDDLNLERSFGGWRAYCNSKCANVMFTLALSRRLAAAGVTANCLHPGFVTSSFGSGNGIPVKPIMTLARPFGVSPRTAAKLPVRLATDAAIDGVTGTYFTRHGERAPSATARDEEAQERLWSVSETLTGLA